MKVHNKLFTSFSITCYRVIYTIESPLSRGKKVKNGPFCCHVQQKEPFPVWSPHGGRGLISPLSLASLDSSPAGRAKCTPVGNG